MIVQYICSFELENKLDVIILICSCAEALLIEITYRRCKCLIV